MLEKKEQITNNVNPVIGRFLGVPPLPYSPDKEKEENNAERDKPSRIGRDIAVDPSFNLWISCLTD